VKSPTSDEKTFFCNEPWTGVLSVLTNLDVRFCPCFLKLTIGNLREASLEELWNAESLVQIRRSFAKGELPEICRGQLCPPALGHKP
jgi:hypothetical protein